MIDNIRLYLRRGNWRWTMRARNGRIIGASSEGYKRRGDALKNLRRVTGLNQLGMGIYIHDSTYDQFNWRISR